MSKGNERKEKVVVKCALSHVSSYLVRDSCSVGLAQSGKYQVSSISGEGTSRYKPPHTYEIREGGEKEKTRKLGTTELILLNAPIFESSYFKSWKSSKK